MSKHLPPSHQGDWPELTKFDQLRIKTEIQLVQLINTELDLGIRDAHHALKSADNWAIAEECHRRADRAYAKASRLIPLVAEITEDERSRVESRLEHLQRMLEALSAIGSTPAPAEDEIAALARAVWEARGCPEGLPEDDWFRAERALKIQRDFNTVCFVG
jgi:HAMP domain-containing protein